MSDACFKTTRKGQGSFLWSWPPRCLGVLLLLPILVSCSEVQIGYSQIDRVLLWKLDRYFDLSDSQEELISDCATEGKDTERIICRKKS